MLKSIRLLFVFVLLGSCTQRAPQEGEAAQKGIENAPSFAMVIHGGAGVIERESLTPEKDKQYRDALNQALDIGEQILSKGGRSIEAVESVIKFMEDSPLFNSGKGAVFTYNEGNELDASIMQGSDLSAGAVGGVSNIKNPITAAIAVMEESPHVLLVGKGAEEFAAEQNIEIVDPSYFKTERRLESLKKAKQRAAETGVIDKQNPYKYGTVGCVALDKNGDLVAGTSTGGMTNKRWNRIGDSPIIGAGTYANNATCGVSCTGHGEFFIRYAVAHDVSAKMAYGKSSLKEAADFVVNEKLIEAGGSGGLVALDTKGNIAMPFNTEGMYRAFVKPEKRFVGIYNDEKED